MTSLIVTLPLTPPHSSTEFDYVLTPDGLTLGGHGRASAALLPTTNKSGDEVIAIVPARALSWHQLDLPKGALRKYAGNPQRLRAILSGLLEERLLDEPEQLHFSIAPNAPSDGLTWVAVCDRAWLHAGLQMLEAAQRPVSRIVPEFEPDLTKSPQPILYAIEGPNSAQWVAPHAQGVSVLPLSASALTALAWPQDTPVVAEPGLAALAEQLIKRPVRLQPPSQRWLQAAQSPWNLAQLELSSMGSKRTLKRMSRSWHSFLYSPSWRTVRWSAGLLLATHLAGLSAWAWKAQVVLNDKRIAIRAVLTDTFPNVTVVVDAPIQMERAVAALQQTSGTASGRDLETLLGHASALLPANQSLTAIEFANGEARLKGLKLNVEETVNISNRLQAQGYTARIDTDTLVIRQEVAR
jgi:general secretion pathway protein L